MPVLQTLGTGNVLGGSRHATGVPELRHILSRLERLYPKQSRPSRITVSAAVGTVLAASVTATAFAVGPALSKSSSAAGGGHASFRLGADVAGADADAATAANWAVQARRAAADRHQAILAAQRRAAAQRAAAARAAAESAAAKRAVAARLAAQRGTELSGTPQQIAMAMLPAYGWSSDRFGCLRSLWNNESGWNPYASNPYSGAYGIPQALPGSKMASAGADWQTNPATQIRWGLGYIQATYGSPCGAWGHETADGWY